MVPPALLPAPPQLRRLAEEMDYLLLVHKNSGSIPTEHEWNEFFEKATLTGMFQGGSELGRSSVIGKKGIPQSTDQIAGFMRFKTTDSSRLESLLTEHPVVKHGGSVELIEMPRTS